MHLYKHDAEIIINYCTKWPLASDEYDVTEA
jgi:hypothetical protein